MKTKNLVLLGFIILTSLSVLLMACKEDDDDTDPEPTDDVVKIGLLYELALFGGADNVSLSVYNMAISEIDSGGGLLGKKFELVLKDVADNPETAIQEFKEDGIKMIIGPFLSSTVISIADYVASNNMLLLPISATSPTISTLDDNNMIWRVVPSDNFQATVAADYIYNTMSKTKVGIVHRDDDWGVALAASFKNNFESLGGTVTAQVDFPSTVDFATYDFSSQCDTVLTGDPDVILHLTFGDDRPKLLNDLYLKTAYQNLDPVIFGVEGLGIDDLNVNLPADMVDNCMAISVIADTSSTSNFMRFAANFSAAYPNEVSTISAMSAAGYDVFYVLAYGMLKAGTTTNTELIAAELKNISGGVSGATVVNVNEFATAKTAVDAGGAIDYNGAVGNIDFDDNGDPGSGWFQVSKAVSGKEVIEAIINYP